LECVQHVEGEDVAGEIRGAFAQLERAGDCVGNDGEAKVLDLRWACPVVRVTRHYDFFVLHRADEAERAGADGMQAEVAP
jgi:hypothetical protein